MKLLSWTKIGAYYGVTIKGENKKKVLIRNLTKKQFSEVLFSCVTGEHVCFEGFAIPQIGEFFVAESGDNKIAIRDQRIYVKLDTPWEWD